MRGVTEVKTVATAAVRDAANGTDFLSSVRALGLDPRLLSGVEEAVASANGVLGGPGVGAGTSGGESPPLLSKSDGRRDGRDGASTTGASWLGGGGRSCDAGRGPAVAGVFGVVLRSATLLAGTGAPGA